MSKRPALNVEWVTEKNKAPKAESAPKVKPAKKAASAQRDPDRKPVTGRLNNDAATALKVLAAREGTTVGHLLIDAINGIFAAHGEPECATYPAKPGRPPTE